MPMPAAALRRAIYLAACALFLMFTVPALAGDGTYIVKKGDTLYAIAKNNSITTTQLMEWNKITDPSKLQVGQTLWLNDPAKDVAKQTTPIPQAAPSTPIPQATPATQVAPTTYTVIKGDTLWSISKKAGCGLQELLAINSLRADTVLQVGNVLRLPGTTVVATISAQPTATAPAATTAKTASIDPAGQQVEPPTLPVPEPITMKSSVTAITLVTQPKEFGNLAWPVNGVLTSSFGTRWGRMHEGIDLGVATGTPVRAAADGVVKFAGAEGDYGRLVIIDHGNGWETYYAHNSQLLVEVGSEVHRSQIIAKSGSTGRTTGPHVHFEVRHNGTPTDPSLYF